MNSWLGRVSVTGAVLATLIGTGAAVAQSQESSAVNAAAVNEGDLRRIAQDYYSLLTSAIVSAPAASTTDAQLAALPATPALVKELKDQLEVVEGRRDALARLKEKYTGADTTVSIDDVRAEQDRLVVEARETTVLPYARIVGDEPEYTAYQLDSTLVYRREGADNWVLASEQLDPNAMLPITRSASSPPVDPTEADPGDESESDPVGAVKEAVEDAQRAVNDALDENPIPGTISDAQQAVNDALDENPVPGTISDAQQAVNDALDENPAANGLPHGTADECGEANACNASDEVAADPVVVQTLKNEVSGPAVEKPSGAALSNLTRPTLDGEGTPPAGMNYRAIIEYAWRYWDNYNPDYRSFSQDCTNFISQALRAGGWPYDHGAYWGDGNWWYRGTLQTHSWAGTENWSWFAPKRTTHVKTLGQLQASDILLMDFDRNKNMNHGMIVTRKTSAQAYLTYHTTDHIDRTMQSILTQYPNAWYHGFRT